MIFNPVVNGGAAKKYNIVCTSNDAAYGFAVSIGQEYFYVESSTVQLQNQYSAEEVFEGLELNPQGWRLNSSFLFSLSGNTITITAGTLSPA